MCGRFAFTSPAESMARLFEARLANDLPEVPNYNLCPTDAVHVVISAEGVRRLGAMRWGFLPRWYKHPGDGPLLINARAETLAEKPAFREAARARRCLILANGFYEWTKTEAGTRQPWYISPVDDAPLAFAGVWQNWSDGSGARPTCAIVTTAANAQMGQLHHRMPLILSPGDWPLWLAEAGPGAARLMVPGPEGMLRFHRVDPRVNSNRAAGPALIEPVEG